MKGKGKKEGREWLEGGEPKETRKKPERNPNRKKLLKPFPPRLTFSDPLGRIFEGQFYRLLQLLLQSGGADLQAIYAEEERLQVRRFQALAPVYSN